MPQPTQTAVHVDSILTNISVAYVQNQNNFIATKVFPEVSVQKQTDKYFTYTKADWFRDEAKLRPDSTESAGSGYGVSTAGYSCDVFALHKDIGDQTRANSDTPLQLETEATQFLTQRMLIRREKQFVTDAFANSIWGTSTTPSNLWSSYTTSDPITDVETGKTTILTNTGFLPNTLVLGYNTFVALRHHPDIVDRINGGATAGSPALVNEQLLATVFGVDRVLVAMATNNTAVEGETAVYAMVAGKHALLCYVNPNPGLMAPSAGYTFTWNGADMGISRFRMDQLRADRIEIQNAWDNKIVATDLGYFFLSVVS